MSADIVDDLHAAEDRIGVLEHALRELLDSPLLPGLSKVPVFPDEIEHERVVRAARLAVDFDDYCRPSCDEEKVYALDDPEFEHDDCCGCPCHERDG